jgi:hypothetical protein
MNLYPFIYRKSDRRCLAWNLLARFSCSFWNVTTCAVIWTCSSASDYFRGRIWSGSGTTSCLTWWRSSAPPSCFYRDYDGWQRSRLSNICTTSCFGRKQNLPKRWEPYLSLDKYIYYLYLCMYIFILSFYIFASLEFLVHSAPHMVAVWTENPWLAKMFILGLYIIVFPLLIEIYRHCLWMQFEF